MLDAVRVGTLPSARFGPNRFSSATRAPRTYNHWACDLDTLVSIVNIYFM